MILPELSASHCFDAGESTDLLTVRQSFRTCSGLEVDLMIETPHCLWGIEVNAGRRFGRAGWHSLRTVGEALGEAWRGGLVTIAARRPSG